VRERSFTTPNKAVVFHVAQVVRDEFNVLAVLVRKGRLSHGTSLEATPKQESWASTVCRDDDLAQPAVATQEGIDAEADVELEGIDAEADVELEGIDVEGRFDTSPATPPRARGAKVGT
jgi:hypothetical protein